MKWLKYISQTQCIDIKHACNTGEQKIRLKCGKTVKVDGFHKETNTVYQFHGFYYHGCNTCYKDNTLNKQRNKYMKDLLKNTILIDNEIRSLGFNLITIWES